MPRITWTKDEIELLKTLHGSMQIIELQEQYFPNKSLSSIKWQIERHQLGKKDYWSDSEIEIIRIMRENRVPCSLIGKVLNRSEQAIRQKCMNLEILSPSPATFDDKAFSTIQTDLNKLDNKLIGTLNEELVKVKLGLLGYDIFLPFMNNHKTDLIIIKNEICIKIQIKSAVYDISSKRYRANFRTKDKNGNHISYKKEDVDFFIVKCNGIDEYYILPFEISIKNNYANLYPHRPKLQIKGFDFEKYRNAFNLIDNLLKTKTSIIK
ncbi:MAG: group I intron-associated PD-(D/E)XK endonuclease [Spirochaetota bacterium]